MAAGMLAPPGLLSTHAWVPNRSLNCFATDRASMSAGPPAGAGTTIRSGRARPSADWVSARLLVKAKPVPMMARKAARRVNPESSSPNAVDVTRLASNMTLSTLALGRRLHFHHLRMLVEVAQRGTLCAAAERLHISRAAVSKALREVESALGLVLFERSAAGMRVTPGGRRVVEHARLLLTEFRHFVGEVGNVRLRAPPLLRLGMSPFIAERWAPSIMGRLAALQPQGRAPRTTLREGRLIQLLEHLISGDIDAAVCLHSPGGAYGVDTSALCIDLVRAEPLMVVAAPDGPLRRRRRWTWADLQGVPWILPPATTHLRRLFDECYAAIGMAASVPVIECSMLAANTRMVRAGLGITLLPLSAVEEEAASGGLIVIDSLAALPETRLVLMYRQSSLVHQGWLDPLKGAVFAALNGVSSADVASPRPS